MHGRKCGSHVGKVRQRSCVSGQPLKNSQTEASWLLKTSQSLSILWFNRVAVAPVRRRIEEQIAELSSPPEGSQPLHFDTAYARSKLAQFRVCLWRNNITWWRSPAVRMTWFQIGFSIALVRLLRMVYSRGHHCNTPLCNLSLSLLLCAQYNFTRLLFTTLIGLPSPALLCLCVFAAHCMLHAA